MKMRLRKLNTLICLVLFAALLVPCAYAYNPKGFTVTAEITTKGPLPINPLTYTLVLTAADDTTPMPDGQRGGAYTLTTTGAGQVKFPEISYDKPGVYNYTLTQKAGDYAYCTYDTCTYFLTVTAVNDTAGELALEASMHRDGNTEKTDVASFNNVYFTAFTPPGNSTPTGVEETWTFKFAASALLLIGAVGVGVVLLRRKERNNAA